MIHTEPGESHLPLPSPHQGSLVCSTCFRAACGGPPSTVLVSAPAPAPRAACGGPPVHGAG